MKIEVLKEFLHDSQKFLVGEVRVIDDDTGKYFCRAGWAKDLDDVVATENPALHETVLFVDNITKDKGVVNNG